MISLFKRAGASLLLAAACVFTQSTVHADLTGDKIVGNLHFGDPIVDPIGWAPNWFPPGEQMVMDPGEEFWSDPYPNPDVPGSFMTVHVDFTPLPDMNVLMNISYRFEGPMFDPGRHDMWFIDLEWLGQPGIVIDMLPNDGPTTLVGATIHPPQSDALNKSRVGLTIDSLVVINEDGETEKITELEYLLVTAHVPEPSTYALLGTCLAATMLIGRRQRKHA